MMDIHLTMVQPKYLRLMMEQIIAEEIIDGEVIILGKIEEIEVIGMMMSSEEMKQEIKEKMNAKDINIATVKCVQKWK